MPTNDRKTLIASFLTALAPSERARLVAIIEGENKDDRRNTCDDKTRTRTTAQISTEDDAAREMSALAQKYGIPEGAV